MEDGSFLKQNLFLTWQIGERQPLFLAVLKFSVEVPIENGAFRARHRCFQPTLE